MPRDGSGVYHRPVGTDAVTDTTIESTKYNANVADVEQDLNAPRPIVAGGTGGNNVTTALTNLGAEFAKQVITNYSSATFQSGSFYSAGSATGAPVAGHAFAGICYVADASNMFIEARDQDDSVQPGHVWVRQLKAGVWSAWANRDFDATAFVAKAGDTMTGLLTLSGDPSTALQAATKQYADTKVNDTGDTMTGPLVLPGDPTLALQAAPKQYVDAVQASANTKVAKAGDTMTGSLTVSTAGNIYVTGLNNGIEVGAPGAGNSPYIDFHSSGNSNDYDVRLIATLGAAAVGQGRLDVAALNTYFTGTVWSVTGSTYQFGSSGTKYLSYDGTNFNFIGGSLVCTNDLHSYGGSLHTRAPAGANAHVWWENEVGTAQVILYWERSTGNVNFTTPGGNHIFVNNGRFQCSSGYVCKQGIGGGFNANCFNLFYNSGPCQLWIDATNLGNISVVSDYRTKENDVALPGMWETVKALRPIEYNHKDFTPPSQVKDGDPSAEPFFKGDPIRRWGFVAHELQETLIPSAASAYKDAPDAIQSPDAFTVIAALTRALQEAMTRIEALEAR